MLFHPFDFGHLKDREISQKYNQAFPVAYNRSIHPSKFWSQLAIISVSVPPKSFSLSCFLDIFPGTTHQSPPLPKNRIFSAYTHCLITTAVFSQTYGLSFTCVYLFTTQFEQLTRLWFNQPKRLSSTSTVQPGPPVICHWDVSIMSSAIMSLNKLLQTQPSMQRYRTLVAWKNKLSLNEHHNT